MTSQNLANDICDDRLRDLIDEVYRQIPADDVFTELELSIVRAIDYATPSKREVVDAGHASMAPLNQARDNAMRIAAATDLLASWFAVVSSPDWESRDALTRRAIRARLLANHGVELPAAEGRLSLLAVGDTLAATAPPRRATRGRWRMAVENSRVSERFAEVAAQAATGARDAVLALVQYADEQGLVEDSLSKLPLSLLDVQTQELSDNVYSSGIKYMSLLRSLRTV